MVMLDFICMGSADPTGVAERPKALIYLSWGGVGLIQILLETFISILNLLPILRSEHLSGTHANEIKHDDSQSHSCFRPRYD